MITETITNMLIKDKIDFTFLRVLKAMKVESKPGHIFCLKLQGWVIREEFALKAANQIMLAMFTSAEKTKITDLIDRLGKKSPLFIARAKSEKENKLNKHSQSITYKVFREVEKQFSDSLILISLIRVEQGHFPESYEFLSKMWGNLDKEIDKRKEKRKHYEIEEIRQGAVLKALEELEKLVVSIEENEPVKKSQVTEENETNDENNIKSEEFEHESNPNLDLQKLRADTIAEINRHLQVVKLTSQDLNENYRQWQSLINNSNDANYIYNIKEKILAVIQQVKKEKENSNKLTEFVEKGEKTDDLTELIKVI